MKDGPETQRSSVMPPAETFAIILWKRHCLLKPSSAITWRRLVAIPFLSNVCRSPITVPRFGSEGQVVRLCVEHIMSWPKTTCIAAPLQPSSKWRMAFRTPGATVLLGPWVSECFDFLGGGNYLVSTRTARSFIIPGFHLCVCD